MNDAVNVSRYDEGLDPSVRALREDPNAGIGRALVHAFYDLVWCTATVVGMPWLLWKAWRSPSFRRMVSERRVFGLRNLRAPQAGRPRILIHGVSVGEIKGARPIVEAIEASYPGFEVLVTSTTDTGMQIGREIFGEARMLRFPIDPSWVVRRFLRRVQPDFVVLIELEIWPNFLRECNRAGVPVAIVNGRITEVSHGQYLFFKRVLPQFNRISLFCVQRDLYAQRFCRLGIEPLRVLRTGNIKADSLSTGRVDPGEELRRLLGPAGEESVIVCGSTHDPEESLIVKAWAKSVPASRLILVPRHPKRTLEILRELEALGHRPQRLSDLRAGIEEPDPRRPALVDTIGELERVYGLADLVFVGGSLAEHGGQNVFEPASQGLPVLCGPHTANFTQEVGLLRDCGALREVTDCAELGAALAELLPDDAARAKMGVAGLDAVNRDKGATARTLAALGGLVLDDLAQGIVSSPALVSDPKTG
ncbi:MAG: 3-deoxy-D-manno-octulosonic-acid transferase [Planctomycetota bacterium]